MLMQELKNQKRKISPKGKFSAGRPRGHPAKKLRSGPPSPGKTSILTRTCRADVHEKNFGLKNFRLIFRSLKKGQGILHPRFTVNGEIVL